MKKLLIICLLLAATYTATAQYKAVYDTTIGNRTYSYKCALPVIIDTVKGQQVMMMDVLKIVVVDGDTLQNYTTGALVNVGSQQATAITAAVNTVIEGRLKTKCRRDARREIER